MDSVTYRVICDVMARVQERVLVVIWGKVCLKKL